MRVLFVYPEAYEIARFGVHRKEFPPFGVLYLGAIVRAGGHEVELRSVSEVATNLDLRGFDAVGFSLASSASLPVMQHLRHHAEFDVDTFIMVGGVHAKLYPSITFDLFQPHVLSFIDADDTILSLLERAESRDFSDVPGALWKNWEGNMVATKLPHPQLTLDALPLPARDLIPEDDVIMTDRLAGRDIRMAHVMFNRGCPYACRFCSAGRSRVHYRSGKGSKEELEFLIREYAIDGFAIVDDNFVISKPRVTEICSSIRDLGLSWSALSRVDRVDPELLATMARAGCIELKFGVESGSERLLTAMGKKTSREQIVAAFTWATEAGIESKAFIMHGYPGESRESTSETIDLLTELGDRVNRVSLFRFVPLPGSEIYESGTIHGTHLADDWDGDWGKFHIHHNNTHWWGDDQEFAMLSEEYERLRIFVESKWNPQS